MATPRPRTNPVARSVRSIVLRGVGHGPNRGVSSPSHGHQPPPGQRRPRARQRADPLVGFAPGPARQPPRPGHPGRPGRCRPARRRAQAALDQEGLEAVGARPRDPDDGPDHPRGEGHAGQDPRALGQGDPAEARRSDDPVRGGAVRLSGARRRGQGSAQGLVRQGRERRHGLPVRPDVPRHQARRDAPGRGCRRRRGRHGHRPRRVPDR